MLLADERCACLYLQWPFSHLPESFIHIKVMTHAPLFTLQLLAWERDCSERRTADMPYRAWCCARRHLCAVTGAPACQRFPGRELPSPMATARLADELSVSSNIPQPAPLSAEHHLEGAAASDSWILWLYSAFLWILLWLFVWQMAAMLSGSWPNQECVHRMRLELWNVTQHRLAGKKYGPAESCD